MNKNTKNWQKIQEEEKPRTAIATTKKKCIIKNTIIIDIIKNLKKSKTKNRTKTFKKINKKEKQTIKINLKIMK